ncbi:glucose-6-phosphate dehydrogenase [Hyphobacterium sp. CCMP332]|uniref:glucose-6-phosphate dehydrogenase n=1 Tax=Hyphobacterium sp. CCMP332 TaxID=2749086 RepID=UPI00164F8A32|nr:glucose-6-phosphate dehydrogenase [Hyphobacterium sp. CCMP332]QNL19664.1 glucose-6-phosphate dehydrogenase [Hyphobacterium sp. CCMP332]
MAALVPVEPFDLAIFGATGDLALGKLLPSLFHRWCDGQIPANSRIIAVARDELDDAAFRQLVRKRYLEGYERDLDEDSTWHAFAERLVYVPLNATDRDSDWSLLKAAFGDSSRLRLFYLALPPSLYAPASENLAHHGLNSPGSRIVLEKPIGSNFHTAREINQRVGEVFGEDSIFRIDHYLGKESVQNLLILRFGNWLFEPIWNATGIDHVQITVAESVGAGKRAAYYDTAGALRDMVQNHLLQLMCLVAMEPPSDLEADTVRTEKLKVLQALRPIRADDISGKAVRARYASGAIKGEAVPGYEAELGQSSDTETFVAIKAEIDNWRWAGVPFYLRTGKRMSHRYSEIVIQFKPVPHDVVKADSGKIRPNRLIIRLQPDEAVRLMLMTKDPGPGGVRVRYVPLNLSYAETFEKNYPDAYERLLMAVIRGNLGLFMRRDEVEAAWRWTDQILQSWTDSQSPVLTYPAGTDGPAESALLLAKDNREWFDESRT